MFRINVDVRDLHGLNRDLIAHHKELQGALISALNKAGEETYYEVASVLQKETGIDARHFDRPTHGLQKFRARPGVLNYAIRARSLTTPLHYFSAVQTPPGVAARPWNTPRVFPGTFIARMPSGHVGVFKRVGWKPRDFVGPRQQFKARGGAKIKELWGPSLAVEMSRGQAPKVFREVSRNAFNKHWAIAEQKAYAQLAAKRAAAVAAAGKRAGNR